MTDSTDVTSDTTRDGAAASAVPAQRRDGRRNGCGANMRYFVTFRRAIHFGRRESGANERLMFYDGSERDRGRRAVLMASRCGFVAIYILEPMWFRIVSPAGIGLGRGTLTAGLTSRR